MQPGMFSAMKQVKDADVGELTKEVQKQIDSSKYTFDIRIKGTNMKEQSVTGVPGFILLTLPSDISKNAGTTSLCGERDLLLAALCMLPEYIDKHMGAGTWDFILETRRAYALADVV